MYDFDAPVNRVNTDCLKWDYSPCRYPLWVADMDFPCAPPVQEALQAKLGARVFGYQIVPDAFGEAVADWWRVRHGWAVDPRWVIFCTGVVPAVTTLVKCLTREGDNVVALTPVYDIFFHSIENTGRHTLEAPLAYDGAYRIDWEVLEKCLAHPKTTLFILCNPHNPTGQVWTEKDLTYIGNLCQKYGVRVLSDEIHCDLTLPNVNYVPYGATPYGKEAVVCVSASKAFNLAGLQGAAVVVADEGLRREVERALNANEVAEPNVLAVAGTVAAFRFGAPWLDELRVYLYDNRRLVEDYFAERLPLAKVVRQRATYLMWIDMSAYLADAAPMCAFVKRAYGVWVTAGAQYRGNGAAFVRVNIACPRSTLSEGIRLFVEGAQAYFATDR